MTGRRQIEAIVARFRVHPEEIPPDRFERLETGRVRCVLCGRTGTSSGLVGLPDPDALQARWWGPYFPWSPWQVGCLLPHDWECSCGLRFPAYAYLWRHIGADRPPGWGRQGDHHAVLACPHPR